MSCSLRTRRIIALHIFLSLLFLVMLLLYHLPLSLFCQTLAKTCKVCYSLFLLPSVCSVNVKYVSIRILEISDSRSDCKYKFPFFSYFSKDLLVAHMFSSWYFQYSFMEPHLHCFKILLHVWIRFIFFRINSSQLRQQSH